MKRTFMIAGTVSLMVLGLASVASAADPGLDCTPTNCKTQINIEVLEGTTLTAPSVVAVGSGFPGQTVDSASQTVTWWSNQEDLQLTVKMDGDLENADVDVDTTIDASNVSVSSTDFPDETAIDTAQPVADIADVSEATLEDESSESFNLHVFIPSATEGTYTGYMTWTVE